MQIPLNFGVIRSFQAADAEALARHANNRKIWLNLRDIFPHPYSLSDAENFLHLIAKERPEVTFAIATDSEVIGCIGLRIGQDVHRKTAELGYWLGEAFWGRGIMSDAVSRFVPWAFEQFDLNRIHAEPFEQNIPSATVLENAGFQREARLRQNIFKDGKVMDSFLYSRTRSTV